MEQITEESVRKIVSEALISFRRSMDKSYKRKRLDEMARVGFIGKKAEYEVYVRTDDSGFIPHVHIWDSATCGDEFDCCVKLETNEYFPHGHYIDKMNGKMCRAFNAFMRQPCRSPKYKNNYELAVEMWNMNNSKSYVQITEDENGNTIIPDYNVIH